MASPNKKFTDHNLKIFYRGFLKHYQECSSKIPRASIGSIYDEMFAAVQSTVDSQYGTLYHLDQSEKIKVYQAFNALFYASPLYNKLSRGEKESFQPTRPAFDSTRIVVIQQSQYYSSYNDPFFSWLLLRNLSPSYFANSSSVFSGGGILHTHSSKKVDADAAKGIALLIAVALIAFTAILAFIALSYMLYHFANNAERVWYGEGWLKAALTLATTIGFGAASAWLSATFATAPLVALAIAAGLNPIGVVLFSIISLTLIGAGVANLVTNLIYDSTATKINSDAMDPSDPKRFALSDSEELVLIRKGIDPIKVKCAIVALRSEIAAKSKNEHTIPSFFSRHYGGKTEVQPLLDQVRKLKRGEIQNVSVGDFSFDCRMTLMQQAVHPPKEAYPDSAPDFAPPAYDDYLKSQVLPVGYNVTPSAPPFESESILYPEPRGFAPACYQ